MTLTIPDSLVHLDPPGQVIARGRMHPNPGFLPLRGGKIRRPEPNLMSDHHLILPLISRPA